VSKQESKNAKKEHYGLRMIPVDALIESKPEEGFENGTLAIKATELKEIFEPMVCKVLLLLTQQINAVT
jgi:hypothetical protein